MADMTEIPVALARAYRDLVQACEHVVCDSPGTPDSVKSLLRDQLSEVEDARRRRND